MKRADYIPITDEFTIDNEKEEARYADGHSAITIRIEGILPDMLGVLCDHDPATNQPVRRLFDALLEFAETRGVSRHPESTLTARLEAAAFGGGK